MTRNKNDILGDRSNSGDDAYSPGPVARIKPTEKTHEALLKKIKLLDKSLQDGIVSKTLYQANKEEIIDSTFGLFFLCFNSPYRQNFLAEISNHPDFRDYLAIKNNGRNMLDIALDEKDIESIRILINNIKIKCPDVLTDKDRIIQRLRNISYNLDINDEKGFRQINMLTGLLGRTMTSDNPTAADVSESVPQLDVSSIEHQDSTTYNSPSPQYMSPTKSSLAKNVTKTPNTQSGKQLDSRCSADKKPPKDKYETCKSFINLLSHKPQTLGYLRNTISSKGDRSDVDEIRNITTDELTQQLLLLARKSCNSTNNDATTPVRSTRDSRPQDSLQRFLEEAGSKTTGTQMNQR